MFVYRAFGDEQVNQQSVAPDTVTSKERSHSDT